MKRLFSATLGSTLALLACALSSGAPIVGGETNRTTADKGLSWGPASKPSVPAGELSDQELARRLGLPLVEVRSLRESLGLSNAGIAELPKPELERRLEQIRHRSVDRHAEELRFRRLYLQDEHGQIPPDAWMKALAQKKQMPVNPAVWPGGRTKGSGPRKPSGPGTSGGSGSPAPLVAGVDSSGWTWLGPGNIGGRVMALVCHPTVAGTMWAGSAGGGVWKTTNGGASWFPLDDFMACLSIACMVMDPQNPNIIYAGTGEGDTAVDAIQGAGIFKTTDGGSSWARLPATAAANFNFVNRLAICPTNNQILLAATGNRFKGGGIYRSTDGGDIWVRTYNSGIGVTDVAFQPGGGAGGPCLASGGTFSSSGGVGSFVIYSSDAGVTWTNATGIPSGGRVEIAYAPTTPSIVYASEERNGGELYRSTDGGHTFSPRNTGTAYFVETSGSEQGWYDNCLWVDPTNPNILVVGGLNLFRSFDGGATLSDIGGYSGGTHPDQHVIVQASTFNGTTSRTVYFGNDGGVFSENDIYLDSFFFPSGWNNLNNNLGITQFYGVAGDPATGGVAGGTQDNGTIGWAAGAGTGNWSQLIGGDGTLVAIDASAAPQERLYYAQPQLQLGCDGLFCSPEFLNGLGDYNSPSVNWVSPFLLDPANPHVMLVGGLSVWRNDDLAPIIAGATFFHSVKPPIPSGQPVSALAWAQLNPQVIWVGYNDGSVYSTTDGLDANPVWSQQNLNSPNLPQRLCASITIDPNNVNTVYATFAGFASGNVWRTEDGGTNWKDISANLPPVPVYSLVVNPHLSSYLYAGTEIGVFGSDDGGATWSPSNDGPANVQVLQLTWAGDTLLAATHGRGCYSIQPVVWVDFNYTGNVQNGAYPTPFEFLSQGIAAVPTGGDIFIKTGGVSHETMPITKPMTIRAFSGPATIGQHP